MADFTSSIWSWYIIIGTVGGIIFCFWLLWLQSKTRVGEGENKPLSHVWDEDLQELNNPLPSWWLWMFYISLVFSIIYLALYPGLGSYAGMLKWTSVGQYETEIKQADERFGPLYAGYLEQSIPALAKNDEAMKTATRLFVNYCSVCHGTDAAGLPGGFPSLTDQDWLHGGSAAQIEKSILDGRVAAMPAWGQVLGKDGVLNVASYVLSLSGRPVDTNAAAAGKVKFQQLCATCHGANGKGNYALGAPNLTDNIWLYGGSQKTVMRTIDGGRNNRMPDHRAFLGEAKVRLLAAYVYGLSR